MKTFKQYLTENILEDEGGAPTNNAGDGKIAGIGVGPQGEPGVARKKTKGGVPLVGPEPSDPRMFSAKIFTRPKPKALVPESEDHPGFDAVADKISSKEGIGKKEADAILAASTRKDSKAAKSKNPRLNKVKG